MGEFMVVNWVDYTDHNEIKPAIDNAIMAGDPVTIILPKRIHELTVDEGSEQLKLVIGLDIDLARGGTRLVSIMQPANSFLKST